MSSSFTDKYAAPFRVLAREFREHLPIWFAYCSAIGLLHAALANYPETGFQRLGIPREDFVPTTAFPLAWFTFYFILRIRNLTQPKHRLIAYLGLALGVIGVPISIRYLYVPYPLSHEQLVMLFEATQLLWVGLFVAQILVSKGWHSLTLFFVVTFIYGLMLENTGIIMRFFFEPSFTIYLGPLPAPLCTMLGWSLVLYIVVSVTEKLTTWLPALRSGIWPRVAVASAFALSLDAQLDPLASMSGVFWHWNDLLPPAFLGVPFINFAAWLSAVSVYSYFVFRIGDRKDWTPGRKNWEVFLRVPLASLVAGMLCFAIIAVFSRGLDGPEFQILISFVNRLVQP